MQHNARVWTFASGAALATATGVSVLALALPAPSPSAPPARVFAPGQSLDGVRIGMTAAQVVAAWGKRHGVCRGCKRTTWYFNEQPFEPQGAAVVFERGRVVHAFTVWQPVRWRTPEGLSLGDADGRVHDLYGPLREEACDGYLALVLASGRTESVFYVYRDRAWAFGIKRARLAACV